MCTNANDQFVREYDLCKDDEQLKLHLKSRIATETRQNLPQLTYPAFQRIGQIRQLTLLPGSPGDEIKCELHTCDLTSTLVYVALSYVWGDQTRKLPIQCGQYTVSIVLSHYSALIRIRKPDEKVCMWVDALCINQANNVLALQERATQVRMMGRIFSQADQVIIDLGGASKEESIRFLGYYREFASRSHYGEDTLEMFDYPNDRFWNSLRRLVRRPWFRRIWVVQELILAREATFLIGSDKFEPQVLWMLLTQAILRHATTTPDPKHVVSIMYNEKYIGLKENDIFTALMHSGVMAYRGVYQWGRRPTLTELLDISRHMAATDLRDHLYALAGLAGDWGRYKLDIDYTKSTVEVRAYLARSLVNQGDAFYCLSRAAGINTAGMTWMPLLRSESHSYMMGEAANYFMGIYYPAYQASGDEGLDVRIINDTRLMIRGIHVDTVRAVAPLFPVQEYQPSNQKGLPDFTPEQAMKALDWYVSIRKWAQLSLSKVEPITARDLLWKAILWDSKSGSAISRIRASIETIRDVFQPWEDCVQTFHPDSLADCAELDHSGISSKVTNLMTCWTTCRQCRICSTERDRIVSVPQKTVNGNEIWILFGLPLPMVLRNLGPTYAVVGPAYVDGLMDGEALKLPWRRDECFAVVIMKTVSSSDPLEVISLGTLTSKYVKVVINIPVGCVALVNVSTS